MVINVSAQVIANKTIDATTEVSKEIAGQAWSYLLDQLKPFTTVVKAVGIVVVIYIIYRIWRWFVGMKDRRRLKNIEDKVNVIDAKLDRLLSGKKSSKDNKTEKFDKIKK